MATPRKHWFYVADAIEREDWPDDVLAFAVRLWGWMNSRRARDHLTADQACRAALSTGTLLHLTRRSSATRARAVLRRLSERSSFVFHTENGVTFIEWPKVAEYQLWHGPESPGKNPATDPRSGRHRPTPTPTPTPTPNTQHSEGPRRPPPKGQGRRSAPSGANSSENSDSEVAALPGAGPLSGPRRPPPTTHRGVLVTDEELEYQRGLKAGEWANLAEYHETVRQRSTRAQDAQESDTPGESPAPKAGGWERMMETPK